MTKVESLSIFGGRKGEYKSLLSKVMEFDERRKSYMRLSDNQSTTSE